MDIATEIYNCARASELIYGARDGSEDRVFCEESIAKMGFLRPSWISMETAITEIRAVAATSQDCHLLVFRGTKDRKDWITDLTSSPSPFENIFPGVQVPGRIHTGFGNCLAVGMDDLKRAMLLMARSKPKKPLLITGHSLGGALAALAGAYFTVAGVEVPQISRIYTFGQPRIGLHDFCETYGRILSGKLVRFVNNKDLVPRVPLTGSDYCDHGMMIHFNASGHAEVEGAEWKSFVGRIVQSAEEVIEMMANLGFDVGDHSMAQYRMLVQANKAKLSELIQI